jgi:hypothetical protein
MLLDDSGKQPAVLRAVMAGQRGAEPHAEEPELSGEFGAGATRRDRLAQTAQVSTEGLMREPEFPAPRGDSFAVHRGVGMVSMSDVPLLQRLDT